MKTFNSILSSILVVIAILVVVFGYAMAKGAPQEASVAGLGCFIAILARIAQANAHNYK